MSVDNYLNYARLKHITETVKPYRKSDNRFPLSYREHRHKCFFVQKDADGNDEYHISYGKVYRGIQYITKEEKEARDKRGQYSQEEVQTDGSIKYYLYDHVWNIVGVVRKDNTFEVTSEGMYLHQGTRYFLSQMFNMKFAWFQSSIKHGGCVYRIYRPHEATEAGDTRWGVKHSTIIPVFKGQKFDLNTNLSAINYEVHIRRIDRAKDKAMLAEHEDDFKFADVMFKSMSLASFESEVKDIYKELFGNNRRWLSNDTREALLKYGEKEGKTDFIKGMIAFMMGKGVGGTYNLASDYGYIKHLDDTSPYQWYTEGKKVLLRQLRLGNDVFKTTVYKANETYPTNSWEPKFYLDGEERKGL